MHCGDRAGFIVNALLFPYLNDAVKMLEAHYATADDIDAAMKVGCGYPMGPFELLDVVGLDVALAIQRTLYLEFREPGFAPAPLLEHLVTAGYLGRKTGRGFRDYSQRADASPARLAAEPLDDRGRGRGARTGELDCPAGHRVGIHQDVPVPRLRPGDPARPRRTWWPGRRTERGDVGDRRHWHTACWRARDRRRLRGAASRSRHAWRSAAAAHTASLPR